MEKDPGSFSATLARVGACAAEATLALVCALGALSLSFPEAIRSAQSALFARSGGLYSLGDLSGTLFLVRRAMVGERGPHTALLGAPGGAPLLYDFPNTLVTDGIGAIAARAGLVLGYNLGVALILASNGAAVYLAVRLAGGRRWAALAACTIGAVAPFLVDEVARGRPVSAWWAPALAGSALCAASLASWRRLALVVPGGLLLGLAALVYPFGPAMLAPWALLMGLSAMWPLRRAVVLRGAIAACVAAALAWPGIHAALAALPTRLQARAHNPLRDLPTSGEGLGLDQLFSVSMGQAERAALPAAIGILGFLAAAVAWREARRWSPALLVGALLFAIALGPGEAGAPTPYSLAMEHIPLLRGAPRPGRYALPGALLACVWLGQALGLATRGAGWRGALPCVGAAGLALAQAQPLAPAPALPWPPTSPPAFLTRQPILLDLPLVFDNPQAQLAQVALLPVPRFNPISSQVPAWLGAVKRAPDPLCSALAAVQQDQEPAEADLRAVASGQSKAQTLGLRYAVLHKNAAHASTIRRWIGFAQRVGGREVWRDAQVTVYALPSALPVAKAH